MRRGIGFGFGFGFVIVVGFGFGFVSVSHATIPAQDAQGELLSARMRGEWRGDTVRVRIDYGLRGDGPSPARVPFAVLDVGGATADDLTAESEGVPLEVVWGEARGVRRSGSVDLGPVAGGAGSGEDAITLVLTYRVHGAMTTGGRVTVPVVTVTWPPAEALPGTFQAEVRLPRDLIAYDVFPSELRLDPNEEGGRVYRTELPVMPSILAFSTTADRPWLTLSLALDAGVVLVLLLLGILGVRHLRRRGSDEAA